MPKDISVEYAHIYTNKTIDYEQAKSLGILKDLEAELAGKSLSLVVMVDDYSFPDPTFNYDSFSRWLADNYQKPDVVIRESQVIPACDAALRLVEDKKLKTELEEYVKAKKYPCSLFIAAWYMVRLGHIKLDLFPEEFTASRLINILPESFKPFEDKGLEIIKSTKFAEAVDKIEYRLFEGRAIN